MRNTTRSSVLMGAVLLILLSAIAGQGLAKPGDAGAGSTPVDLNRASASELTSVPGIGQATADRIVAWREEHGPFRRVEDLMKVRGIGEKSFEKLRPYVTVARGK